MKKTIKKTAQMRLDELIKYVRQNKKTLFKNRVEITFSTKNNNEVIFYQHGELTLDNWISSVDLFEVVIEEEITEDTVFGLLVEVSKIDRDYFVDSYYNHKLYHVIDDDTEFIYTFISGKPELIYKKGEDNNGGE